MDMPMTARQQALIARLYDAALDDALWPQLCRDLADAFGVSVRPPPSTLGYRTMP